MSTKKQTELTVDSSQAPVKPAKAAAAKAKKAPAKKTAAAKAAAAMSTAASKAVENTEKPKKSTRTPAKKVTAKKSAAKTAAADAGSNQTPAQVEQGVEINKIEAEDGAKVYAGIEELAEKKPAKKKAAKKKAASTAGSHQTEAEIAAGVETNKVEAEDGAKVYEGIEELAKTEASKKAKKAAAKKPAAKKTAAKKSAAKAAKAPIVGDSDQTAAQIEQGVEVNKVEAQDGAKVFSAIEAMATAVMASCVELAKKSAAENNAQKNLSARSVKDAKIAAKGFKKPRKAKKKKAANPVVAAIAAEAKDGARVYRGIEAVEGTPYEETVASAKAKAAAASRAVLSAKSAAHTYAQINLSAASAEAAKALLEQNSHQTEAEIAAGVETNKVEALDGAKVYRGIETTKGAPYENEPENPGMPAREELAAKSAAENNAQKNLSARSEADAKIAAKGFKKPARKKAKLNGAYQTKAQEQAQVDVISKEAQDGARVYRGIEAVEGTPYETVVENAKKAAAAKARTALAAKAKAVKGKTAGAEVKLTPEKEAFYQSLDDQTLCEMAQAVGLDMDLETLKDELQVAPDIDALVASYVNAVNKADKGYVFEKDGFDASVVPYLCDRIAASLPNKAQDNAKLAAKIEKDVDRMLINDAFNDTAIYNDLMDDVRSVLVYAQRHHIDSLEEMEKVIPTDLHKLIDRFMTVAYTILPGWQYRDVQYYQGFLYGVLSQFDDLAPLHNRAMMDVADLYILHGDYNRGNADYGYVLRENDLKDQIYYRFANIYRGFDYARARGIAQDALRVIDGRYEYYPLILEILQS